MRRLDHPGDARHDVGGRHIARFGQLFPELEHALLSYRQASRFDIVSDHSGLGAAAMADLVQAPVVHTVHSTLNDEHGRIYRLIAELNPRLRFISTSLKQREPAEDLPWIANCPSALDLDAYPFSTAAATTCCSSGG